MVSVPIHPWIPSSSPSPTLPGCLLLPSHSDAYPNIFITTSFPPSTTCIHPFRRNPLSAGQTSHKSTTYIYQKRRPATSDDHSSPVETATGGHERLKQKNIIHHGSHATANPGPGVVCLCPLIDTKCPPPARSICSRPLERQWIPHLDHFESPCPRWR